MPIRKKEPVDFPQHIRDFVDTTVSDGTLTKDNVTEIIDYVKESTKDAPLDEDQLDAIGDYTMESAEKAFDKPVPLPLKIIGVLVALDALSLIFPIIEGFGDLLEAIGEGSLDALAATTIVLLVIGVVLLFVYMVLSIILGVRLVRNKRTNAARIIKVMTAVLVGAIVVDLMIDGIESTEIFLTIAVVVLIVLENYLNISIRTERDLRYQLTMIDTEQRAKTGTLGLKVKGKGYAKLDFVNIFWIFVIGCVIGIIVETIFTMTVTHPGVYENRTGMLFGPFSPIYGFGGVLMTIALNRYQNSNIIFVFIVCTVIGGCFEYFVSWFMEVGFGAKAWDYHGHFLGDLLNGRTCLLFASMFGALGTFYIKVLLPLCVKLINKIPWKARYIVTGICAAFMIVNGAMTLQALDNWYGRVSGKEPVTATEKFYAEYFDDEWMQNHFQTMTITPSDSIRGQ